MTLAKCKGKLDKLERQLERYDANLEALNEKMIELDELWKLYTITKKEVKIND